MKADKTSLEEYTTTSGINTILDGYADRTEVGNAIQFELGYYTTSADIDARFNEFSTDDYMPASRVNELLDEKDAAILTVDNRVYAIETELSGVHDDPTFNISGIGNNRTFEQVVYAYAPPSDLSTLIDKPADYTGDLKSYIETKAPNVDSSLELKANVTDPVFNISDFGDNKSLNDIIQQYAPAGGGGADLSDGHVLADQELLVKSFYEYGEENGDAEYDNQLRLFENGKYSATEIIEKLGKYVTDYMMEMFDKHSWPLITEEHAFNIDRFYIKFLMDRDYDLNFTFDFSNSTYIKDLFQLNTTIQSTRISMASDYQSYIYFDIDLSGNEYTKLDDRISRNVINIRTRLDDVESALPDLDQPVLMDLKLFGTGEWVLRVKIGGWGITFRIKS